MTIISFTIAITQSESDRIIADPDNVCPQPTIGRHSTKVRNMFGSIFQAEAKQMVLIGLARYMRHSTRQLTGLLRFGVALSLYGPPSLYNEIPARTAYI